MKNKIGLSTFVLASPFSDNDLSLMGKVKSMGYDVLEVCIEDPTILSSDAINVAAKKYGINISICGAFGPDRDISHEDPIIRAQGIAYLYTCIDFAAEVGSPFVCGPMYSATGKTRLLSPEARRQQFDWAVESIVTAANYAQTKNVRLAIEPLNRFETDLINTLEQGVELCRAVGLDNVGLLIDTFHMHIEEKSLTESIRFAAPYIFHVQVSENDRGTPGKGQVHWDEFFAALNDINYQGSIVVESFLPTVKEIARAVSLWRSVAPSMDALAIDGFKFINSKVMQYLKENEINGS
jgi:D-psicose/D-tagatose/L-ribulose 3-epimerase